MQPPPEGTLERSAWDYLTTTSLALKLAGPERARRLEREPRPRRLSTPGRPPELRIAERGMRTRDATAAALRSPRKRAKLLHAFLHHELQAAELMCWAMLAFADAPPAFRRGLMAIARDEARHMGLYRRHLRELGHDFGDFPVRDWFWQRIPECRTPATFVATMGIGFEGGNLDHTTRFAARFRAVGDERAAELQERIGREEEPHVRFALRWFRRFGGDDGFGTWLGALPSPLSPVLMRGRPIDRAARLRAGMSNAFLDELHRWDPAH